jgi:hypothetical protein
MQQTIALEMITEFAVAALGVDDSLFSVTLAGMYLDTLPFDAINGCPSSL